MNITCLEDKILVLTENVGIPVYDFSFEMYFRCSHPICFTENQIGILRVGAIADYKKLFYEQSQNGISLTHSPEHHARASELVIWYPILKDLTPKSEIFESLPEPERIEKDFAWPIFLKGSRQTSKHNPALSIIHTVDQYRRAVEAYRSDPILYWQQPVVRQFVPLAPVPGEVPGKIRPSLEFRSFWWQGKCICWGQYWYQVAPYRAPDIECGLAIAQEAAARMQVPFLVVDFAKALDGHWIIIECNDAQESGYASIPPHILWRNLLDCLAQ